MKKIRKAVILAAWYGTRFLPATKSVPKEMFPVVDKPIIQYVVNELVAAWIEQITFVTSSRKKAIEDYFDSDFELEQRLDFAGKDDLKDQVSNVSSMAQFVYIRQKEPKGTGDAILLAKNIIGDEPFIVCFGDDFIVAEPSRSKQLMDAYYANPGVVLAWIHSENPEDAKKYWFAGWQQVSDSVMKVDVLVEKPGVDKKPSNTAVVSWCILPPEIFWALEIAIERHNDATKEVLYIDGINILHQEQSVDVHAVTLQWWKYYDCWNVLEYIKTNIEIALWREDIWPWLREYINSIKI